MKNQKSDNIADNLIDGSYIENQKAKKEMLMLETLFDEDDIDRFSPQVVLAGALMHAYGPNYSKEKFDLFQTLLLKGLSKLSTRGNEENMFGRDFDDFFSSYIKCLNKCGQMYKLLKDNGIDFDFNDGENYDNV